MKLKSIAPVMVVCLAVAFVWSACSTAPERSTGESPAAAASPAPGAIPAPQSAETDAMSAADEAVNREVKTRLFNDPRLSAFAITAHTSGGVVTLTGAVDSEADKKRAADLAGSVDNVKSIRNLITLK